MLTGILFIGVGLLLVFLEFFLPGAVMGVVGGLVVVSGLVLFSLSGVSLTLAITVVVATFALLALLGMFALRRIRRSRIYLADDQEGYRASLWQQELIGRQGEVVAACRPSGHVSVDGERYQALSRMGYLDRGIQIEVVGGRGAHLIVKRKET